jgi:hypothetical protein
MSAAHIEPFRVRAGVGEIEDLRARLRATRWPDAPEDAGWSLGVDLGYLRELVTYWAEEFDWPAQEAALARLPRFRSRGLAFLHQRAAGPVLPLVLCHGVVAVREGAAAAHRSRGARRGSG